MNTLMEPYRLPDVPGWYGWLQEVKTPDTTFRAFITVEKVGFSVTVTSAPETIVCKQVFPTGGEVGKAEAQAFAEQQLETCCTLAGSNYVVR